MSLKHFLLILLSISIVSFTYSQNVVVVIIDGARYTETFGDESRQYVKYMDSLSHEGTIITSYYNRHKTYTSQAIPALWTGSWAGTRDTVYNGMSTQYTLRPTVFEYFRKQKQTGKENCIYVLKYVSSLWLQSFYPGYGPDYWPYTVSDGSSDKYVEEKAKELATTYHPRFLWVYLADVDHAGHTGDWQTYTSAIKTADSLVFDLWNYLQSDAFYKDNTYLFVTNDHGRHDDAHGGFQNHGDDCEGCQHIMFLALGPDIRRDYVVTEEYETQDFAVTVAHVLGVNPEFADGRVIDKIFTGSTAGVQDEDNSLRFYVQKRRLRVRAQQSGYLTLTLYNTLGLSVWKLNMYLTDGQTMQTFEELEPGTYIIDYRWENGEHWNKKIVVLP